MDEGLEITRRRLPHWRLTGSTYLLTWRIAPGVPAFTAVERDSVAECLCHFHRQRYTLLAYVVMEDHVHVVVCPKPDFSISRLCHTWKSYTAHTINKRRLRSGKLRQDESYDRIIRDEEELIEKLQYILDNPVQRCLEADYRWVRWFPPEE